MCGLFGILRSPEMRIDPEVVTAACAIQAHRGPDGSGIEMFALEHGTLLFAHQRLSIIDLTEAGRQPMTYGQGEGSLIYNGELYNYLELRAELAQASERFATRSDTEVLLAALHRWGVKHALEKFNWMGAFAWLDRSCARLVLACDSGSEKPLYYYRDDAQFIFSSEIKTLLTIAGKRFALERDVVGRFIFQGLSDDSTQTFFRGITRLQPGSYLEVMLDATRRIVGPVRYTPPPYAGDPSGLSLPDFVEEVRRTFTDAVRIRLRSDVPVGVLLSGGVDSSSIAAVAHGLMSRTEAPRLLSAISEDPRFDESVHIALMERHLGQIAEKVTLRTAPNELPAQLSTINWHNDAPVTGLAALGHYRLMERARQLGLKVILSGQGADEILLGYRKFLGFYLQSLLRHGNFLRAAGVLAAFVANGTVVTQFDLSEAKRYVPFLRWLGKSRGKQANENATEGPWLAGWQPRELGLGLTSLRERQRLDISRYSVPLLCHYEDRMSMAMSREIRLPFLDSRLIDLLLRAPDDYKIRNGWTKYCFRKAMASALPSGICWRKDKQGFANPQGEWLKHELHSAIRSAFSSASLISQKRIVDSAALLRKYESYCRQPPRGGLIWYREIFAPFSLELWMQRYEPWIE